MAKSEGGVTGAIQVANMGEVKGLLESMAHPQRGFTQWDSGMRKVVRQEQAKPNGLQ
jgi:hypothetical protein